MRHRNGQHGRARALCRHCEDGGDPRDPIDQGQRNPQAIWDLHALCDPVNEFCACPCDTGELEETA